MSLSKAVELAVTLVMAVIRQLPAAQQAKAFDAAAERLRFEAEGQRKLEARKRRKGIG